MCRIAFMILPVLRNNISNKFIAKPRSYNVIDVLLRKQLSFNILNIELYENRHGKWSRERERERGDL